MVNDMTARVNFPYFPFYTEDYFEATRHMTLEERGAYMDMICLQMMHGGQVRDDERWISHQMHISTRKWRAVREKLVEHRKIRVEGGLIIQERCLKELDSLLNKRRTIAESAANRERAKRENSKKANEINVASSTVVTQLDHYRDRDRDIEIKETPYSPPAPEPQAGDARTRLTRAAAAVVAAGIVASAPVAAQPMPDPAPIARPAVADMPNPGGASSAAVAPDPVQADPVKPAKKRRKAGVPEAYTQEFECFWKIYPRREGKAGAFQSWQRLTLEQQRKAWKAARDQMAFLTAKAKDPRGNFCPLPATWINQGRFDDEPQPHVPTAPRAGVNGSNYSLSGAYVGPTL